jgi:hypothetical protein
MATKKKPAAKKAPAKKAVAKNTAKAAAARSGTPKAGSKTEQLMALLKVGATVEGLCAKLGWQAHTLRAALTRLPGGAKTERTRKDGITSYKLA